MTDEKKTRSMTAKWFLSKSNTKAAVSANAFLSQYREWLENGELADTAKPILLKLDQGVLMPTPALKEIQSACLAHIIKRDTEVSGEKPVTVKIGKEPKEPKERKVKAWESRIYNAKGEIQTRINSNGNEEDLVKGFDKSSDADGWTDRRLFEGASDWFGEVVHTSTQRRTIVLRDDSIARILKVKRGPVIQQKSQSTDKLSFGVKAKESRAVFSKG